MGRCFVDWQKLIIRRSTSSRGTENYAPYKYDLRRFSPVGPTLFDHADPSIFTVLTSASETPRHSEYRISLFFPTGWLVAENTFRPPWYHMNVMSEFMGLIYGQTTPRRRDSCRAARRCIIACCRMAPMQNPSNGQQCRAQAHKLEGTMAFMLKRGSAACERLRGRNRAATKGITAAYGKALPKYFDPKKP